MDKGTAMNKVTLGMRPDTNQKCAEAYKMVQEGSSVRDAIAKVGVSTATFYMWKRHKDIPRTRNFPCYDREIKHHDIYQEILDKYLEGENVFQYFSSRSHKFYSGFHNWRRRHHPNVSVANLLPSRGYQASQYIDETGCTYQEAAEKFGISRQRVEQVRFEQGKSRPMNRRELFQRVAELESEVIRLKKQLARLGQGHDTEAGNTD
jgi:transposase-like protein